MTISQRFERALANDDVAAMTALLAEDPSVKDGINSPNGPFGAPAVTRVKSSGMLDVLLGAGADIDAKSDWWAGGFGLLHVADKEVALAAIDRGATVDVHAAARLGLVDQLRRILDQHPGLVNARGGDGQTPLHFATTLEAADLLLDFGADIDALDVDHVSTPAQYMAGGRQDVARRLVERGCSIDILLASALGDLERVKAILKEDPESIRTRVSDEWYPMIGGENGGTIYQWELGWYVSSHQVAKRFGHSDVLVHLLGASPSDLRLTTACWLGDAESVERILEAGRPEFSSAESRQLAHACRNNDVRATRLMMRAGLPVASRSQHGATSLHWACWHGNAELARLLIEAGADIHDHKNDYDGLPLGWAIHGSLGGWGGSGDFAATVQLLLEAGATLPDRQAGSQSVRDVLGRFGVPEE